MFDIRRIRPVGVMGVKAVAKGILGFIYYDDDGSRVDGAAVRFHGATVEVHTDRNFQPRAFCPQRRAWHLLEVHFGRARVLSAHFVQQNRCQLKKRFARVLSAHFIQQNRCQLKNDVRGCCPHIF